MRSPKIFPICHKPCLSNFSTVFQKGTDGINEVSRTKNDNFTIKPGLIISKVFALNRKTIFQSECPDLTSNVQELKDMVTQLMSNISVKTNCRTPDHSWM